MTPSGDPARPASAPRRGRPNLMARETVLDRIRALGTRRQGLFRVHLTHAALYARARRLFGSWASAVIQAGLDHRASIERARARAVERRARARRLRRDPGVSITLRSPRRVVCIGPGSLTGRSSAGHPPITRRT